MAKHGETGMFHEETLIFIIEAMAANAKIHKDIDELYKTKSRAFNECAAKSDLIGHPLIVCGNIRHEEYGRKLLGILLYATRARNKETLGSIDRIIQRGWPRAYGNAVNHRNANISDYIDELKSGCKRNAAESFAELFMFYNLCAANKAPAVNPAEIVRYFMALSLRSFIHSNDRYFDSYGKKDEAGRREVDRLKDRICGGYGVEISPDNRISVRDKELRKYYSFFYRLAYTDKIELYYLFRELELSEKDIRDVLCAYTDAIKNSSDDEAARLFLSGIIMKLMVKSVVQAKEYYFQHTAEQMHVDKLEKTIDGLMAEKKRMASENGRLKETISGLTEKLRTANTEASLPHLDKIRELERTVAKQDEAMRQEQEKERELAALRSFFFDLENRETGAGGDAEEILDMKDTAGAIIGGNPKWNARMKELLPKWVFISSAGFDKRSLDGLQTMCFLPNCISHSLYYKAIAIAKNKKMDIGFIYSQNERLAMREIAKILARAQG